MSWKNPYIDKLQEYPDSIIAGDSQNISAEDRARLRALTEPYNKIFLEFGSGSGAHLIGRAAKDTNSAYVGFELRYKRAYRTIEKAAQQGLENIFVARTTALIAPEIYPSNSIAGIFVNFPDPWEKKKWKKHRLLNPDFLQCIHSLLKEEGGFLSYKTDHEEYYDATRALVEESGLFTISEESRDLHSSQFATQNILTEFENLFISKKLPTYYLLAHRTPAADST